ncbi:MAG: hypothetical protein JO041_07070 [Acidobacteria bacterium]|nr:hypothetical protein [Acidobacteriota bacterium]
MKQGTRERRTKVAPLLRAAVVALACVPLLLCTALDAQPGSEEDLRAQILSLQRESAWYAKVAAQEKQSAEQWRASAQTMREIGKQKNNKDALELADNDDARAKEIAADAERLQGVSAQKAREAQQLQQKLNDTRTLDLTGFWQDAQHHRVMIVQSGERVVMDLGNGIALAGTFSARSLAVKYKWTAEEVQRHIKSESESGPQAVADRQAALKSLVGKVVRLSGTVNNEATRIAGTYDEDFEADAETSSKSGTAVHSGSPAKAEITLTKEKSQPHCSTQTVVTVPSDRSRSRIGVGEQVMVRFVSSSGNPGAIRWSVSGGGQLSGPKGTDVMFTAGDRGGAVAVTGQSASGEYCSAAFTVVEPEEVILKLIPNSEFHINKSLSCGFLGTWIVLPGDVSFSRIEIRELEAYAPTTIKLLPEDQPHHANPEFAPMGDTIEGLGTPFRANFYDQVVAKFGGVELDAPVRWLFRQFPGVASHRIPYEFRVGSGEPKQFTYVLQIQSQKDDTCTISKGGVKVTRNYDDPTSDWKSRGISNPF